MELGEAKQQHESEEANTGGEIGVLEFPWVDTSRLGLLFVAALPAGVEHLCNVSALTHTIVP